MATPNHHANGAKTHCRKGHSYKQYGFVNTKGSRECRLCERERSRQNRIKAKARKLAEAQS